MLSSCVCVRVCWERKGRRGVRSDKYIVTARYRTPNADKPERSNRSDPTKPRARVDDRSAARQTVAETPSGLRLTAHFGALALFLDCATLCHRIVCVSVCKSKAEFVRTYHRCVRALRFGAGGRLTVVFLCGKCCHRLCVCFLCVFLTVRYPITGFRSHISMKRPLCGCSDIYIYAKECAFSDEQRRRRR